MLVAALALLAGPATAFAATLSYEGSTLVYKAGAGEANWVHVTGDQEDGKVSIGDSGADISFPADRCTQLSPEYSAHCDLPAAVRVELGDRDDLGDVRSVAATLPITILGGAGADRLKGTDQALVALDGQEGDDKLESEDAPAALTGGPGNDHLLGGGGSDTLIAGDGDDYLRPDNNSAAPGDDIVDGGPGNDKVEDWVDNASSGTQRRASVTLDGQANDGRPGEHDNVTNVEHLVTFVPGTWVMSDAAERVESYAPAGLGPSTIEGRGGDDVLLSGNGAQTIDGGNGADRIEGGFGDDILTGGPGADVIAADFTGSQCGVLQSCTLPHGNDTIFARDGEADTIDCGVGTDRAIIDPQDTVSGCEQVEQDSGGVTGVAPGNGAPATRPGNSDSAASPGNAAGAGGPARSAATLRVLPGQRLRSALRTGLRVRASGMASGALIVRALRGGRQIGSGIAQVSAGGDASVTVRFRVAARRTLRRARSARVVVRAQGVQTTVTLAR